METSIDVGDDLIDSEDIYSEKNKIFWIMEEIDIFSENINDISPERCEKIKTFFNFFWDTIDHGNPEIEDLFEEQLDIKKKQYPKLWE